jgi:bacterioferritin
MGTRGRELVGMDLGELVKLLNKALADEWFAYYQYWIGAKVVTGPMRQTAVAELTEHAADELRHAEMLSERILQLGGTPITDPNDWSKLANCAYIKPIDFNVKAIIQQGIEGERCAIDVYSRLLETTKEKDFVTHNMLLTILSDEVEHEEDFEALLEDLVQVG